MVKEISVDLHGCIEAAEVLDLRAEDEIAELRERQEDDEEHDGEASQILGAARQSGGQLSHGFVEADVLKHLQLQQIPQMIYMRMRIRASTNLCILYMYVILCKSIFDFNQQSDTQTSSTLGIRTI